MGREPDLVIVTGASRGVGRATASALMRDHGCSVIAIARDSGALTELGAACKGGVGRLETLPIDLAHTGSVEAVKRLVDGRRVRALVHNAGILLNKPIGQYVREDLNALFATNVFAPLELSQALLDEMEGDPPGHIVHVGSMGGYQDSVKFAGLAAYSASKAALACMAQCLAEELKDRRIKSNCLALGSVDTEMLRAAFPDYRSSTTPEAMGAYVARFALDGHNLFNGKVLPVASTTP